MDFNAGSAVQFNESVFTVGAPWLRRCGCLLRNFQKTAKKHAKVLAELNVQFALLVA